MEEQNEHSTDTLNEHEPFANLQHNRIYFNPFINSLSKFNLLSGVCLLNICLLSLSIKFCRDT